MVSSESESASVLHSMTYLALQGREGWAATAAAGAVQQAGDGVGGLRV